jgi:uncharacterized protein
LSVPPLEEIFAIPIVDKWLLHAPLHGTTAIANKKAITQLAGEQTSTVKEMQTLYEVLQKGIEKRPSPHQGHLQPEFLGIIPTRMCNLQCRYCGFGALEATLEDSMELSTATAAVDWMIECIQQFKRKSLDIHFFGGEPFVAPDLVDCVIHYARSKAAQSKLGTKFETVTNGFFDEERCKFVGDYFDTVVFSFDGPEEIQNRHRPRKNGMGSYQTVARNAQYLSQSPCKLCIRICVTQDTVLQLPQMTQWFCHTFRPAIIDFEILKSTSESISAGLQPADPWDFAVMCIRSMEAAESYGVTPVYAAASIETIQHSFCPVGRDVAIISPDRRIHACYLQERDWKVRGLDMNMGSLDASGAVTLDSAAVERIRQLTQAHTKCKTCFCQWHCAGGCHVVNHSFENLSRYNNFCLQTRIITAYRLLKQLGQQQEVEQLIQNKHAMELLALHESDRLSDWKE